MPGRRHAARMRRMLLQGQRGTAHGTLRPFEATSAMSATPMLPRPADRPGTQARWNRFGRHIGGVGVTGWRGFRLLRIGLFARFGTLSETRMDRQVHVQPVLAGLVRRAHLSLKVDHPTRERCTIRTQTSATLTFVSTDDHELRPCWPCAGLAGRGGATQQQQCRQWRYRGSGRKGQLDGTTVRQERGAEMVLTRWWVGS